MCHCAPIPYEIMVPTGPILKSYNGTTALDTQMTHDQFLVGHTGQLAHLSCFIALFAPRTDLVHIATHLCHPNENVCSKKAQGSVVSNLIGMKFGRIVSLQIGLNTHRLTESDFWFCATLSRWRPWGHFTQWKVLPSGECTRSVCPASVRQFLIHSTFVSVLVQVLCGDNK